jgi:hypothetical protein
MEFVTVQHNGPNGRTEWLQNSSSKICIVSENAQWNGWEQKRSHGGVLQGGIFVEPPRLPQKLSGIHAVSHVSCHQFQQHWLRSQCVLVWCVSLAQVLPLSQLIFASKTSFFRIYLDFQWQKSFKNQYLPHSESKCCQINSIKSCSLRSFQQHKRHFSIPLKFSVMI